MPSWNIHIAHAEELLASGGALAAAVCDRNAFLFGNVLPDIRVGYMVPGIVEPIPYRITHFAKPEHIPKPREWEFWDAYVAPAFTKGNVVVSPKSRSSESFSFAPSMSTDGTAGTSRDVFDVQARVDGDIHGSATALNVPIYTLQEDIERLNRVHYPARYEGAAPFAELNAGELLHTDSEFEQQIAQSLRDMLLGTWVHLLADNIWNTRVNELLESIGGKPSEGFRIKKQGDFDWFGKTLSISSIVRVTDRLVKTAARFPQYPISRDEVLYTAGVVHEVVRDNPGNPEHPAYRLLSDDFFTNTFAEVSREAERLFTERML